MMTGSFAWRGLNHRVLQAELHLPRETRGGSLLYLRLSSPEKVGLAVWGAQVPAIDSVGDLDGKRLHTASSFQRCSDDSLGTDLTEAMMCSDLTGWWSGCNGFEIVELEIEFRRIDGAEFACGFRCRVNDEDQVSSIAEGKFRVVADEIDPWE